MGRLESACRGTLGERVRGVQMWDVVPLRTGRCEGASASQAPDGVGKLAPASHERTPCAP
ncbi:hypothetical protein GCM10010383_33440 [Streptomyces lomondensis]|uniref:Uncharacterized protein n=1 Tax=Streptomyces lomondensis TaxID=68229 RepID=A0ABQ2X5N1_9ACTN|nr:hypothetical protein GCM10010383_33440 [Streptomyces lomondensis]